MLQKEPILDVPKWTTIYFSVAPGQDEDDVVDGAGGDSIALNVTGLEKPTATKMSVSLYGLSLEQVRTLAQIFFSLLTVIIIPTTSGQRGKGTLS